MTDLSRLLSDAEAYAQQASLSLATVSRKLFGDGTRIRKMRASEATITVQGLETARSRLNALLEVGEEEEDPAIPGYAYTFKHAHLLGLEGLSRVDIEHILDLADTYADQTRAGIRPELILKDRTVVNLFFENSTRTMSSFEIAAKRLGADVVNMPIATSSVSKGETLIDTAMTLNAMKPDVLVIRHSASGGAKLLSRKVDCAVINAGDGTHEHPTQGLLDTLTIRREKGKVEGLKIVICGDIAHSRVARSTTLALHQLGGIVHLCGPRTLLPSGAEDWGAASVHTDFDAALEKADVVMMLRLQMERMDGAYLPSRREYFRYYGLTRTRLALAKKDAIVMHPGPMNRGIEIESAIADGPASVITEQVEMGVAVRSAVLHLLAGEKR